MKVVVVGGAGYIGSTLSHMLWQQGHDVTVLDLLLFGDESLESLKGQQRFQLVPGDLRDETILEQVIPGHDAVVLLAAIVGEPACNRDPEAAVSTNLHGARKVLAVSKKHGVKRFIFSSTCSNYGVSDKNGLVDETAPLQPLSTYSETKVAFELDVLAANSADFYPTVLRFSTAFGVSSRMRFDLLVSDFTLAAVRDHKIVIYGEQFWRPFVHVQDISKAVITVLHADPKLVAGDVFNVGSNAQNIKKIELGHRVIEFVKGTELEFVKRDTDPRSYRVDFSKIEERLGYKAEWTIDDGIQELHEALNVGQWEDLDNSRYYN